MENLNKNEKKLRFLMKVRSSKNAHFPLVYPIPLPCILIQSPFKANCLLAMLDNHQLWNYLVGSTETFLRAAKVLPLKNIS